MKHHAERRGYISPQTYEVAERYGLGRPLTEYRLIFLRREIALIMRCIFTLILLVIVTMLLIQSFRDLPNRSDVKELLLVVCVVALFVFWIIDVLGIFRRLQDVSQQCTSLLVCQEGFLYFHNGRTEVVSWQQILRYALTQLGISRQITIYCTDDKHFHLDDRLDNFGNFLWRLTCQLMKRDRTSEDTSLSFPKVFRVHPTVRKKGLYLLLGGVAMVEGILWLLSLNDHPLFAPLFGVLQFFLGWIILVALVMVLLRQRLVSKLQIVLSQEGIIYDGYSYSIYTPWQNIVAVEDGPSNAPFGLRLCVPARQGMTVKEGQQQKIAVFERHGWGLTEKLFRKRFLFADVFPLDSSLLGSGWLQGEFARYLRIYAPQVCEESEYTE